MKKLTKRQQAERAIRSMEYIQAEFENIFGGPMSNWGYNPTLVITCAKGLLQSEDRVTKATLAYLVEERNHLAKAGNEVAEAEGIDPVFDLW